MKRYAIKVRIQSDYLYEIDAETQEAAEERATEMAHEELDNGNCEYETISAAVPLTGEHMSMFDVKVGSMLDEDIHSQV